MKTVQKHVTNVTDDTHSKTDLQTVKCVTNLKISITIQRCFAFFKDVLELHAVSNLDSRDLYKLSLQIQLKNFTGKHKNRYI